jgi:hypothetical protein
MADADKSHVAISGTRTDNRGVRTRANALLALAVSGALVASASGGHLKPAALYRALLVSPLPASSLPAGFAPPVSAQKVADSPNSRAHRAVGVVQVFLNGGSYRGVAYSAGGYYDVFPTSKDALADYRAERGAARVEPLKSLPGPARSVISSLPNGGMRYLGVELVHQNVRVFAYVANRGENPLPEDALALATSLDRAMLKHLEKVSG